MSAKNCEMTCVGAEAAVAAMSEGERLVIGMHTYRFVRRVMRDPEIRARIEARAAQIRAEEQEEEEFGCVGSGC